MVVCCAEGCLHDASSETCKLIQFIPENNSIRAADAPVMCTCHLLGGGLLEADDPCVGSVSPEDEGDSSVMYSSAQCERLPVEESHVNGAISVDFNNETSLAADLTFVSGYDNFQGEAESAASILVEPGGAAPDGMVELCCVELWEPSASVPSLLQAPAEALRGISVHEEPSEAGRDLPLSEATPEAVRDITVHEATPGVMADVAMHETSAEELGQVEEPEEVEFEGETGLLCDGVAYQISHSTDQEVSAYQTTQGSRGNLTVYRLFQSEYEGVAVQTTFQPVVEDDCAVYESVDDSPMDAYDADEKFDSDEDSRECIIVTAGAASGDGGRPAAQHKKMFTCDICHKSFTTRHYLGAHARVHTGEAPYACAVCGKRFRMRCDLKRHGAVHTGERRYACALCGACFSTAAILTVHTRTHTGERPYGCAYCPKRFASASNRRNHERIHTGSKPYVCGTCGRGFTEQSSLAKHGRVHVPPAHACARCPKRYRTARALIRHATCAHGEVAVSTPALPRLLPKCAS